MVLNMRKIHGIVIIALKGYAKKLKKKTALITHRMKHKQGHVLSAAKKLRLEMNTTLTENVCVTSTGRKNMRHLSLKTALTL